MLAREAMPDKVLSKSVSDPLFHLSKPNMRAELRMRSSRSRLSEVRHKVNAQVDKLYLPLNYYCSYKNFGDAKVKKDNR